MTETNRAKQPSAKEELARVKRQIVGVIYEAAKNSTLNPADLAHQLIAVHNIVTDWSPLQSEAAEEDVVTTSQGTEAPEQDKHEDLASAVSNGMLAAQIIDLINHVENIATNAERSSCQDRMVSELSDDYKKFKGGIAHANRLTARKLKRIMRMPVNTAPPDEFKAIARLGIRLSAS